MFWKYFIIALVVTASLFVAPVKSWNCKCSPTESCWPSQSDWDQFNSTVGGNLIAGVPPGLPCYPGPHYNETTCDTILDNWFNSTWHAGNPVSVDYPEWTNNSCNPIFPNGTSPTGNPDQGKKGCHLGRYPSYIVNATSAEEISAALKFAAARELRLIVKNTGHNLPGRNLGYGSLSIWTHNLKNITWHTDFQLAGSPRDTATVLAAEMGAGVQDIEIYTEAAKHNAIVVGGSNPTVGVVGWFQGGGHGPLSSSYGMGADNLLQATVVTPTGKILIVNSFQNTDLYWALRGGGGGTFGVIVDIVMKAFPSPQTSMFSIEATIINPNITNPASRWWSLIADLHALMPALKNAGAQGYYNLYGPPMTPSLAFVWSTYHYNTSNATILSIYEPVLKLLNASADFVGYQTSLSSAPSFFEMYMSNRVPEPVAGGAAAISSRLLTVDAVADFEGFAAALEKIGPQIDPGPNPVSNTVLLGNFVANSANRNINVALNPVWRDTVSHFIVVEGISELSTEAEIDAAWNDISANKTNELRKLTPGGGCYFNEANPYEPDWQWAFFNQNYPRLRDIKKKYDPNDVLWCRTCVGSENWIENADGTLCKRR